MAQWLALTLVLGLAGLGPVVAQRTRPLAALAVQAVQASPADGLDQILGDGQPEDIGYGYQRSRNPARAARTGRQEMQGLLLLGKPAAWQDAAWQDAAWQDDAVAEQEGRDAGLHSAPSAPSAFRERMASRQRRQRAQQQLEQQQQQQRQPQQQWGDWHRDSPGVSSFYPAGGPAAEPVDNPERYLQALREAWVRYQQQTGTIDVGPDDLTDLETLQFLEALGEDIPGAKKRSTAQAARPAAEHQGTSSLDWAAPLVWSGYQLRKRSANPDEDDSDDWADDRADDSGVLDDDEYPGPSSLSAASGPSAPPGPGGNRLAMLLTEQLFDERYNDPAVKRLLLTKRSAQRQDDVDELGLGHAMRRRKKSTRPALAHAETAPNVQKDLARIFGEPELGDGEPEPPLALPLAAAAATTAPGAAPTATATTTAGPNKNATKQADGGQRAPVSASVPINPIGHAHETDKIAREHGQHGQHPHQHSPAGTGSPATHNSPNTQVHVHEEHAPPMVAAEGPHGHDQAVHAEDKEEKDKLAGQTTPPPGANGVPVGAAAAGVDGEQEELPIPLALSRHRRIAKKSIDWSQYFGLDRRRKKSTEFSDAEDNSIENAVDADWLLRHNLMGFKSSKAYDMNKREAVKKEGASDAGQRAAWDGDKHWHPAVDGPAPVFDGVVMEDDEEGVLPSGLQPGTTAAARTATFWARDTMGRCPAVGHLAQSCRGVVGRDNGLVPICVLYRACHLCGPYVGLPEGSSCVSELYRLGAAICTSSPQEPECRAKVKAVARLYSRDGSLTSTKRGTCAQQPCLAYFFLTAPAVAFAR